MQQQVTTEQAMARAVELAARGLGRTAPNPVVGCVILDTSGAVVGEGEGWLTELDPDQLAALMSYRGRE